MEQQRKAAQHTPGPWEYVTREQLRRADVYRDMHNLLLKLYESDEFRCLIGQETLDETERLIRESGGF